MYGSKIGLIHKEADAAKALIDQGADIIMQHTDSAAAMTIAEEQGIYAFGQASDMIQFGPNAQLTAIIDDWAPYYVERTQALIDKTWESKIHGVVCQLEGFKLADISDDVPKVFVNLVNEAQEGILTGEFILSQDQ
ncbi:MAG: hypothetical protein CM15mP111_2960 [Hyphomicrobiales bacterium]|nr:MAG: hypothetical protein CM15mP111_2960 [Hyphomicrobiales bacterium]